MLAPYQAPSAWFHSTNALSDLPVESPSLLPGPFARKVTVKQRKVAFIVLLDHKKTVT